mgnify:CR=1 FL=1
MAKIIIPTPLRKFTDQERSFRTNATSVQEGIDALVDAYPDLKQNLLNEENQVRSFIKIYVEDEEVKPENTAEVDIEDDTVISIVPAIAGGCCVCKKS